MGEVFLKNLTFHLGEGDRLALFGANGSGKTLLLKILATLVKPTSGTVTIGGHDAFKSPGLGASAHRLCPSKL